MPYPLPLILNHHLLTIISLNHSIFLFPPSSESSLQHLPLFSNLFPPPFPSPVLWQHSQPIYPKIFISKRLDLFKLLKFGGEKGFNEFMVNSSEVFFDGCFSDFVEDGAGKEREVVVVAVMAVMVVEGIVQF